MSAMAGVDFNQRDAQECIRRIRRVQRERESLYARLEVRDRRLRKRYPMSAEELAEAEASFDHELAEEAALLADALEAMWGEIPYAPA